MDLIHASLHLDIAGANGAGWHSVLVRTGVYEPKLGRPSHTPTHEAADVEAAVQWAINREHGRWLRFQDR